MVEVGQARSLLNRISKQQTAFVVQIIIRREGLEHLIPTES